MFFRRELLRSYKSFTSVDFQNLGTGISPRKGALGAVVVKHYTNSAWETFDLPNIHNFVADSEPAKVAQMPANSTFSILSSKYITRNLGDIQLLFRAFGTSNYALPVSEYRQLRDLVVFKPERVALHELMIGVSTEYQIRDDEHFNAVVDALYQNEIMSQLSATESEINNAHEVIENYVRAKVVDKTFLNALVQDKIDLTLKSQHFVASQRIADKVDEKTLVDVVKKSTVDILLKNYTTAKISGIVTAVLEQTLAKGKEKRLSGKNNSERERIIVGLSKNKNNKRMTYMVAGGPATGKSSLVARIMKSGVNLQDYCTIAPDRLLPLLTNRSVVGPNEKYHAELLSEECRVVVEGIQKRLLTMMKLNGEAPNVLIEMLVPYEDKVELGTYGEGRFKVFVTSYKPELAVEGGYQRFLNQGRFVPKEYVLEGQKRLSVYLPSMVDKYKNSGKKILIEIYDTYTMIHNSSTSDTGIVASIAPSDNLTVIYDLQKTLEFMGKKDINVEAKHPGEVIPIPLNQREQMLELKKLYGNGVIKFVSKETMGADVGNLGKYIYATYHANPQQLEIHQPEVFERATQSSEYLSLFRLLDAKIDTDYVPVPALKN